MTAPRSSLVSVADTPFYHCTGRCVRRAYLCGQDAVTGKSFEHRRGWFVERLAVLADVFAIELCAYAVMNNHYHLVLRLMPERADSWPAEEVIGRWCRLFKGSPLVQRFRRGESLTPVEAEVVHRYVVTWRERLGDLSWFERCLNEHIARRANAEDGCSGHFWESRFHSQALLDEQALLAAMVYVELNPVRAGMADTLEDSDFTSIQARLSPAGADVPPSINEMSPRLAAFAGQSCPAAQGTLPFSWSAYVELLAATGRHTREGKRGSLAENACGLLATVGLAREHWMIAVSHLRRCFRRALGAPWRLQALAERSGLQWIRGKRAARQLYATGAT